MVSENILIVENLKKYYELRSSLLQVLGLSPPLYLKAVDDIGFSVAKGEIFCLVGESGCGKTTTGKIIVRLLEPTSGKILYKLSAETRKVLEPYGYTEEYIDIGKKYPKDVDKVLRREIQMIFQDPYSSLNPRMRIRDILEEPLVIQGIGKDRTERLEIILRALTEVKLVPPQEFLDRYPHMLSGGQRQRIAIARALILKPNLIVADEPVSMLDVSIRVEVLQLMLDIRKSRGISYIFITHDLAVASYICDRMAVMYLGKIVESGDITKVIDNPMHPYTRALMEAVPEPNPSNRLSLRKVGIIGEVPSAVNVPPGCRFHPRCPFAMDVCRKKEPPLVEVEKGHNVACWLHMKK
uniref:ABC transporter ATP-binding protein n=1 Tax=Ignisphaera aggregans TaxID=334771 RepID=A0A7C4FFZ8_9CREN